MRSLPVLSAIGALLLLGLLSSPAQAKIGFPRPPTTVIAPSSGAAGLKLGGPLTPAPRGWLPAARCLTRAAVAACAWVSSGDAFPPAGQTGISGPFILAIAEADRVVMLTIGAGDRDRDARPLRAWKTRSGIGFESTPRDLGRAYPSIVRGRLKDQWVLWARGKRIRTNFRFAGGRLNRIEINDCARASC